jgi:hypothetical protein
MANRLAISSDLDHDGDGVVRYRIDAQSPDFRGGVWAWGNDTTAGELTRVLQGFPRNVGQKVEFTFGTHGTGVAKLRFEVASARGECRVWVSVSSEYAVANTDEHQSASLCIGFFPAALDAFCQQLGRFKPQRPNAAELIGNAA